MIGRRLFRTGLCVPGMALAAALLAGCSGGPARVEAGLGEEFSLSIGQSASITGEDLEVTLLDVVEDSRCPRGVVCVWEGRVTCSVEFVPLAPGEQAGDTVMLTQPGLTDGDAVETYRGYRIAFRVIPYPEAGEPVPRDEYRLLLTITK
jgi:hypothetical protein